MRGGILILGLIFLILGIFLYFNGNNMKREVEAYDTEGIPISELLKIVSPEVKQKYETGQSLVMFGTIFGIVGFILCIGGIVAPSKSGKERKSTGDSSLGISDFIQKSKEQLQQSKKTSQAECELCGKLRDTRDLKVYDIDGKELFLCEKCGNRVTEKSKKTSETEDDVLKILKLRYAKGEITKENYEQMKKDLEG